MTRSLGVAPLVLFATTASAAAAPDAMIALRVTDAAEDVDATTRAARTALEAATPGRRRVDDSGILGALWGPFLHDARVDPALPAADRADVEAALRTCARHAKNADAESSFCRRGLVDVLWRRHGARVDAAVVVVAIVEREKVDPLLAAVAPERVPQGPTWFVSLHAARRGAAGRMAQMRGVTNVADVIKRALPALFAGEGAPWPEWPEVAGEIPAPPPPPPTARDLVSRIEAAAAGASSVVEPAAVSKRAWCRGPLPLSMHLTGVGPAFAALVERTFAEARRAGLARWKLEPRGAGDTHPAPAGDEAALHCALTLTGAPAGAVPGGPRLPERAFFELTCGPALPRASGALWGTLDDGAAAAAAVVDSALEKLCLRS